jgi:hypothetical protein
MPRDRQKKPEVVEDSSKAPKEDNEANLLSAPVVTLPKFDLHERVANRSRESEAASSPIPLLQTYDDVQREATGPGADEWRRADKLRADLTNLYNTLREDPRYNEEYKAETAWRRYEEVREQIEQLAPEARAKMLKSAEGLERLSVPVPDNEPLATKDTTKLLLTAHERTRIEGMLTRAENARGPLKRNPHDILKDEYKRGLDEGGPAGGAVVRAVVGIARDFGLNLDAVVDEYRKASHRGCIESAEQRRMQAHMIGRSVPQPPFSRTGSGPRKETGTYRAAGGRAYSVSQDARQSITQPKKRRPYWK